MLITDIVMPEMGGGQLATQLGKLLPRLKVVYMPDYHEDGGRSLLTDNHGIYLQKPVSVQILSHKVRELLTGP